MTDHLGRPDVPASSPRTVTVPTPDGPVVLPEPDWCT